MLLKDKLKNDDAFESDFVVPTEKMWRSFVFDCVLIFFRIFLFTFHAK